MKKIFYINDTLENRISYYILLIFLVFLPFDRFYSEWIFISFCIHTLIHSEWVDLKRLFRKKILLLQSVFLLAIVSSTYSLFRTEAFQECLKLLSVFLFPLMLCLTRFDLGKYRGHFLSAFAFTCVIIVLYLNFDAMRIIFYFHFPISTLFTSSFLNQNFSKPIDLHPTYLGMYLLIAMVYLLSELRAGLSVKRKVWLVLGLLILSLGCLQASSKSVLIACIIILVLVFPFYFMSATKRIWLILSIMVAISLFSVIIITNIGFKERLFTEFKEDLSLKRDINSKNEGRLLRWSGTLELIGKSPIIGYGMGSEKAVLNDMYFQKKLYNSFNNEFDAHNQYLSLLLTSGIIGLFVYLFTLYWGFRMAIKGKDFLFTGFLVIIIIVGVSENILMVNKGIFFYSFFFSLFCFANKLSFTGQRP